MENLSNEIWKDVEEYNGLYEISNSGRLKSLPKLLIAPHGGQYYTKERIIKTDCKTKKYPFAILCNKGIKKQFYIHRLVASAFIPNPDNKPQVNHINGDKKDNRVENLEWCTNKENMVHAKETGLKKQTYGTYNPNSKLNEEEVNDIRKSYSNGSLNMPQLALKYRISNSRISDIINRKIYTNFQEENKVYRSNFIAKNQRLSKTKYLDYNSVKKMRNEGKSYSEIGNIFNMSIVSIRKFYIENSLIEASKTKVIAKN